MKSNLKKISVMAALD